MENKRDSVKILGIVGSPRAGNTEILVEEALRASEALGGVETDIIRIAPMNINPCVSCFRCFSSEEKVRGCPTFDDDMTNVYPRLAETDGIVIGTPVYFGGIYGKLKVFLDRTEPFVRYARTGYGGGLANKVGGAIAVGYNRNGGQETSIQMLHSYFLVHDMIVVGSGSEEAPGCYYGGGAVTWPTRSRVKDAVLRDELGLKSARGVGRRVAEVAQIIKRGRA